MRLGMHALSWIASGLVAMVLTAVATVWLRPLASEPPPDVLVVSLATEPRSLDPHTTTASSDTQVNANLYEGLLRFKAGSLEPEPALAERFSISQDGRSYVFHLKRDVRFHDGTPLTARAVQWNFERMLDPRHPYHHTGPFPLAFFFEDVAEVTVLDAHTVSFRLKQPFAPLLANLAYPAGYLVSPAAVQRWGTDYQRHPAGTGPFYFEDWLPGRRIELRRNPHYHGAPARSARLALLFQADAMTRIAELRSGRVDIITEVPADHVAWFARAPQYRVLDVAGPHLWFLILNTREPPFDDVRVRQAVNYAIDKHGLVRDVLQGTARVAAGPIAAAFGAAAGDVAPYPYDPARARALLAAAQPTTRRLLMLAPQSGAGMLAPMQMAAAIQADLAAVGFELEIQSFEWNTYLQKVNSGLQDAHMAQMAWMTNDPDTLPYLALRSSAVPPEGFNSGWYHNPKVDALLERARIETHPEQRAALYARLQRLVHDDAPWLFVAHGTQTVITHQRVENLELQPSFLFDLSRAHKQTGSTSPQAVRRGAAPKHGRTR